MAQSRRLGRGLDALLSKGKKMPESDSTMLDPDLIAPSPAQPRTDIAPEAMEALIESVSRNGILQPLVVRQVGQRYELVAGERRWRAAQHLGLSSVPVVVRDVPDEQMLELALVENIQREDLNPMEKARAFRQLIQQYSLTQAQAAERVGMDRSSVANFIRLLDLPSDVQDSVSRGTISMGHARALLACRSEKGLRELAKRIGAEELSVRDVERLAATKTAGKTAKARSPKSADTKELEAKLADALGTQVSVQPKTKSVGRLVIRYTSLRQLDALLKTLGVK